MGAKVIPETFKNEDKTAKGPVVNKSKIKKK